MGLFRILKAISGNDKYDLNKKEKEMVKKGYYQPDEFDRDDDIESDEDYEPFNFEEEELEDDDYHNEDLD